MRSGKHQRRFLARFGIFRRFRERISLLSCRWQCGSWPSHPPFLLLQLIQPEKDGELRKQSPGPATENAWSPHAQKRRRFAASDQLQLWPDGLRTWFFGLSFILDLALSAMGHWGLGSAALVLIALVVPAWLYSFGCLRVLDGVFFGLPNSSLLWMQGVPGLWTWLSPSPGTSDQRRVWRWKGALLFRLRAVLPETGFRSDAVIWRGSDSAQGAVLIAALTEFFGSDDSGDTWLDHGFRRWVIYWCAPVWSGYAFLFAIAAYSLVDDLLTKDKIVFSLVLWTRLSALFLYRQLVQFHRWAAFRHIDQLDRRSLPLDLYFRIRERTELQMPGFLVQGGAAAVIGALVSLLSNWIQ
jgi:hypothetical protein